MSRLHGFRPAVAGSGRGRRLLLCLLLFAVTPACIASGDPAATGRAVAQPPLDRVDLCLQDERGAIPLRAERAETDQQRSTGLMGRTQLADDAGMLFVYGRERGPGSGFWMYQTLLPLDIAYLGPEGEIRAIRHMEPCPHENPVSCPSYPPGVSYWSALEVNQGFFLQHGFDVGARVTEVTPEQCGREPGAARDKTETGN